MKRLQSKQGKTAQSKQGKTRQHKAKQDSSARQHKASGSQPADQLLVPMQDVNKCNKCNQGCAVCCDGRLRQSATRSLLLWRREAMDKQAGCRRQQLAGSSQAGWATTRKQERRTGVRVVFWQECRKSVAVPSKRSWHCANVTRLGT